MKVKIWNLVEFYDFNKHSVVLTIQTSIVNNFVPLLEDCKQQFDFSSQKTVSHLSLENIFPVKMVIFRNKRKLVALNKEYCEENPRSNLAQSSNVPRSQEDYITKVSRKLRGESQIKCQKSSVG